MSQTEMSLKDIATLFNIPITTLWFWRSQAGLTQKPNANRRWTEDQVIVFRDQVRRGKDIYKLATLEGVDHATMYNAVTGRSYKTVPNPIFPDELKRIRWEYRWQRARDKIKEISSRKQTA